MSQTKFLLDESKMPTHWYNIAAGGVQTKDPQDHGFMYTRTFEDLDGHVWEIFWMNPDHVHG